MLRIAKNKECAHTKYSANAKNTRILGVLVAYAHTYGSCMVGGNPVVNVLFLKLASCQNIWWVSRVGCTEVKVMRSVLDHHCHQGVRERFENSPSVPGIQCSITTGQKKKTNGTDYLHQYRVFTALQYRVLNNRTQSSSSVLTGIPTES